MPQADSASGPWCPRTGYRAAMSTLRESPTGLPAVARIHLRAGWLGLALFVVLGLVLGVVLFGRQAGANRPAEQLAAEAVTVTVQPGDTLWTIARSLAPDDDPRPLTDALVDLAGGTSLQPGQRIVIPGSLLD